MFGRGRAVAACIVLVAGALPACVEGARPGPASPCPPPATAAPAAPASAGRYDAIIVGAGMAGLTAANMMRQAGLRIVVLEATNRIGGRAITTETLEKKAFEAPIDLGGAWIHGVRTNPLTPVAVGMGFRTTRTDVETSDHLFFNHRFADEKERSTFGQAYDAFEKRLAKATEKEGDEARSKKEPRYASAADYLVDHSIYAANRTPPDVEETLKRLIALNAGPLEGGTELALSSIEDATDFISEDDDFVNEGYGTFVEKYGQDVLPVVRLGMPVTKITTKSGGVVVEAGKGEVIEGRKVLVTVSTGVLTAKKITFEPDLPTSKWDAIRALPMGVLDKVILQFKSADVFPEQDHKMLRNTWVLYGGDDRQGNDDLAFVLRPLDTNIAVGFFGGQRAKDLESKADRGREAMIDVALRALTDMCKASRDAAKCDVKGALVKAHTTAWASDPWALGAYSAALPGMAKMREDLAEPVNHIVYFAGEACYNSTYNGSFAGAYNSALRATHAMIDCLRREERGEACVWERMTRSH